MSGDSTSQVSKINEWTDNETAIVFRAFPRQAFARDRQLLAIYIEKDEKGPSTVRKVIAKKTASVMTKMNGETYTRSIKTSTQKTCVFTGQCQMHTCMHTVYAPLSYKYMY